LPNPALKSKETSFMDKCNIFVQFQHVSSKQSVKFYGIITNLQDSFRSTWTEQTAYGRVDPIPTWQSTQRQISLGFTILSEDDEVGNLNMRDISSLVNMLYPTYDGKENRASTLSAAPLIKLKFNNLVTNAAGTRNSIGADVSEDGLYGYINGGISVVHDIDAGYLTPKPGVLIPRQVSVNFNFTVLHTHELGWTTAGETRTNGSFPYKTGPKFTNRVARGGNGSTRFTDPGAPEQSTSPTVVNDNIPPEILEAQESDIFGGAVGVYGEENVMTFSEDEVDVYDSNPDKYLDGQVGVYTTAKSQQDRRDASRDSRTKETRLRTRTTETSNEEMDKFYDSVISPEGLN